MLTTDLHFSEAVPLINLLCPFSLPSPSLSFSLSFLSRLSFLVSLFLSYPFNLCFLFSIRVFFLSLLFLVWFFYCLLYLDLRFVWIFLIYLFYLFVLRFPFISFSLSLKASFFLSPLIFLPTRVPSFHPLFISIFLPSLLLFSYLSSFFLPSLQLFLYLFPASYSPLISLPPSPNLLLSPLLFSPLILSSPLPSRPIQHSLQLLLSPLLSLPLSQHLNPPPSHFPLHYTSPNYSPPISPSSSSQHFNLPRASSPHIWISSQVTKVSQQQVTIIRGIYYHYLDVA